MKKEKKHLFSARFKVRNLITYRVHEGKYILTGGDFTNCDLTLSTELLIAIEGKATDL